MVEGVVRDDLAPVQYRQSSPHAEEPVTMTRILHGACLHLDEGPRCGDKDATVVPRSSIDSSCEDVLTAWNLTRIPIAIEVGQTTCSTIRGAVAEAKAAPIPARMPANRSYHQVTTQSMADTLPQV